MIPPLPNPTNPALWVGLALIALYFGVDYMGQLPALLSSLGSKIAGYFRPTNTATTATAVVTSEQAFSSLCTVSRYLSKQPDSAERKAILAGIKELAA